MTKLQKYFLISLIGPFLAISFGLSFLALFTQSLTQLDLLIERGQSPLTILSISILATPQFLAIVAPIAIFATTILVYGRLYSENEIVVAFAGGQSNWNVSVPILRLASLVALSVLFINSFIQPISYQKMREKLFAIRSDIATTLVREGQFRQPINGLTIYTRQILPNGDMNGLIISDQRNINAPVTFVSQTGGIVKLNGQPAISMTNGSVQRVNNEGKTELIGFTQYIMELGGFDTEEKELFFKPQDRFTQDLFDRDRTHYWDRDHKSELLAEGHRRFASPLNSIACAFLGLYAILGGAFSRRGFGGQILKSSIGVLLLLLAQTGLQSVFDKNSALNIFQYLIPIATSLYIMKKLGMIENLSSNNFKNTKLLSLEA